MKRLLIVCDLDSIVINLLEPWLDWYNKTHNDQLTIENLVHYEIEKIVKPECGLDIYKFFHQDGVYDALPALAGAIEGLRELWEAGHDIVICSATSGDVAPAKYRWVAKNLPFIPKRNMFTGIRKEMLHCDVFIDDSPHNIAAHREFKAKWPVEMRGKIFTIAYPYNESHKHLVDLHAAGYKDTLTAWRDMNQAITLLAEA